MGQGWWGWGEERDGDTKQNKPTRPTKGKMKSSAFVHRTVRCWRRKVSWCNEEAHSFPTRRGGHQGAPGERPGLGPAPGRGLSRWVGRGGESRPVGASNLRAGSDPDPGRAVGPRGAQARALLWQRLGLALRGSLARPPRPRTSLALALVPWQGPPLPLLGFLPGHPPTSRQHPALPSCTPLFPSQHPRRPGTASRHRLDPRVYVFAEESLSKAAETTLLLPAPRTPGSRFASAPSGTWGCLQIRTEELPGFRVRRGPDPGAKRRRGARLELPAPRARALEPPETKPRVHPGPGAKTGVSLVIAKRGLWSQKVSPHGRLMSLSSTEVLKTPYKRASWVPRRSALPASASPERGPGAAV